MRLVGKSRKKRRSAGEGSVRWHDKLKVYEARLYVPKRLRPAYGGKASLSFYAKQEGDALEKREAARRDMNEGRVGRKDLTIGAYLKNWLDGPLKHAVSERTQEDYRYWAERHLIPPEKIGDVPISELGAEDLDALYARLLEGGMGARGVNHVHATVRVALQRAVKKRLIPYNPARDADPPRYSTEEREYLVLSRGDVGRFFDAAAESKDRFEALWIMAVLAGPRPAELRALRWEDLELPEDPGRAGLATIRRSAVELKSQPPKVRNTTKTGRGRGVHLFPQVVSALKAHRVRQNEERLAKSGLWKDGGLVFPTTTGTIITRSNLTNRHFKPLLAKAGLPSGVRLYDLRHTFATLWLESGQDLKILQEVLGHSRIETTANHYLHPSRDMQAAAFERFSAGFSEGRSSSR